MDRELARKLLAMMNASVKIAMNCAMTFETAITLI